MKRLLFAICLCLVLAPLAHAEDFELKKGDHICIVGNTLADRMQHFGWLETLIHARYPQHELVFRNLGYSGDEINQRLRSMDFGSPDQWLAGSAPIPQPKKLNPNSPVEQNRFEHTNTKADVIFAFFGYNESFAGEKGLPKFKQELDGYLRHLLSQKYNGKSAPRVVLFSPIAQEYLRDPNLPDPTENNKRLDMYTAAMAETAKANNVRFVDLFHISEKLYSQADKPLTINGIHLNAHGDEQVARSIKTALFGESEIDPAKIEKVHAAVNDKNLYWYNRYRTVDGYSTYGDRAFLRFVGGQTNYEVVQRELQVIDIMTANRDKVIWAAAQGKDLKPDDSNTPPFIPVITNKPGSLPGGKHLFLSGEEAISKMTLGKGLKINLFADEKMFPELSKPVQMAWDAKGRLWVAVWPSYPHWKPKEEMNDKIIILEDTKGTGKADKMTVFADHLSNPTGFEFYNGGVLVAQAPDLMFLKDTTGGDHANLRVRVLSGLDTADTHHTSNSFALDPGGAVYFQEGTFHHTQVETPYGPPVRCVNAGVYRYEPRTQKFESYISFGFANPHGHVFDHWGQDIVVDGTGSDAYHAALFSGQVDYPNKHSRPPKVYQQHARPCPGVEICSSKHFPDEFQGNFLVADVIQFQGILRYKLEDNGASFRGVEQEPMVRSTDPNFRPSDLKIGPDGALYFLDWQNPIIGHMQHNLRDPSRDREHGRIYRITYEGRPLDKPVAIAGEPLDKLLNVLKEPEDRVRHRARIELGGRPTSEVMAAVKKWIATLDPNDANYEHHLLEALWLHQSHNVVDVDLLQRMLRARDFHARAAATRVLCYWRDRVPKPLDLLRVQINDEHPRVRLEAIRALSFFNDEAAINIAIELLAHPEDEYLAFVFGETLNTLERRMGNSKLDRKNIAASLLQMLQRGQIPAERQPAVIETICKRGGANELKAIWEQARKADGYPKALRLSVLEWLTDAALTRKIQPNVVGGEVIALLKEQSANDLARHVAAIRLASAWKVPGAELELWPIALGKVENFEVRKAAIEAIGSFANPASRKTLLSLAERGQPTRIRFQAVAALAQSDLAAAAKAGAQALTEAGENDDPARVVEAFLNRKGGSDILAAALEQEKVPVDTAKRIMRAMYLAGRSDAKLSAVVSKLAGLGADPKIPTPAEVKQLEGEVMAKGDPARGERVFRRMDLGCIRCHAINRAGGNVGPDLGAVGGSSPLDYIITSILDPNASVKEAYLTKVINTKKGNTVTGIVVDRNKDRVLLKDATGKLIQVPQHEIEDEQNGRTLMPDGITKILTYAEQLDLMRFVSELGKPGPYAVPTTPAVLRWKKLKNLTPALKEGVPNREVVRETLLRSEPDAWDTVYALVNGTLPLDDIQPATGVIYLQGEISVVQGGTVEIDTAMNVPATFWVDEETIAKPSNAVAQLVPGLHRITVRVEPGNAKVPSLRVGFAKPPDSKAQFEVVNAE
ncbi:MAG TPA: PVC-type heme-binding CxxCH protein [Gemmataceae bacterium]|jgi:putative heme-binding domain-containing protein|nr:PVC-type heme-binding CxxCH protein [Gemmataceae bacterium]